MNFRDLRKDEIDVRVGEVGDGYFSLLLYKDARVDMAILDETVGAGNWQRKHYECKGNLFCSVGIKCEADWVWKDDCGTESQFDKEKGEASDSFKRACVNWGIGRELYTAPRININCDCKKGDKSLPFVGFLVDEIIVDNKVIKSLRISAYERARQKRIVLFENGKTAQATFKLPTLAQLKALKDMEVDINAVATYYKTTADKLTFEQVEQAIQIKEQAIAKKEQANETK